MKHAAGCVLVGVLCLPWAGGCGDAPVAAGGQGEKVLTAVVQAYVTHLRTHRYKAPANEAEFKDVLQQAGAGILERAGVKTVDQLLVSPRDFQPFVIAYGKDASRLLEHDIVAHEKTGVSGRRLVGYDLGYVEDVDEQTFKRLLADQ